MHPLVLQSITEQRLEELRSGVSGRPNKRRPRTLPLAWEAWPDGPHPGKDGRLDGRNRIADGQEQWRRHRRRPALERNGERFCVKSWAPQMRRGADLD